MLLSSHKCISAKWNQANILHADKPPQKIIFSTLQILLSVFITKRSIIGENTIFQYFLVLIVRIFWYFCLLSSSSSSAVQLFVSFGFLSIVSFPVPSVSNYLLPSSPNRLSRHHPILILAFLSVLLRVVSIYKCF